MGIIILRAINWFAQLIAMALLIRAVLSFIGQDPYSGPGKAYRFFVRLTEPVVSPCRRLIQRFGFNTGMFDFSIVFAMLLVQVGARALTMILVMFL